MLFTGSVHNTHYTAYTLHEFKLHSLCACDRPHHLPFYDFNSIFPVLQHGRHRAHTKLVHSLNDFALNGGGNDDVDDEGDDGDGGDGSKR